MSRATEAELADLFSFDAEPAPAAPPLTPGRALFRRSRSLNIRPRKHTLERMQSLIGAISQMPVAADACMRAGISYTTLKYWLMKSTEGVAGDGFDIPLGVTEDGEELGVRFHEAWEDAMHTGVGRVEVATHTRALGYREPLTFQGRVSYEHDFDLIELFGGPSEKTYKRDPITGDLIPETIMKQDPDLMMFILKTRMPEKYGNKQQIDITHRGGVLVVGAKAVVGQEVAQLTQDYKADAIDVDFDDLTDNTI